MKEKGRCIVCSEELQSCAIFEGMPANAQNMPDLAQLETDHGISLNLCQCPHCGLVQFDTEPVWYCKDVIRAGGETKTMREIRVMEYNKLLKFMKERNLPGSKILEVGCGRGEFIHMWEDPRITEDVRIIGIEHKKELVEQANSDGLEVYEGFAQKGYLCPEGPFDAFVQFNFLEHQPDPLDMLKNIRAQLRPNAVGLVTVPGLEYILAHNGYYELIRDHIAYYSEKTLARVMQMAGFEVLRISWVNRDTIEVLVANSSCPQKSTEMQENELLDATGLLENHREICKTVDRTLERLQKENKILCVWGASHQGFTVVSTTNLGKSIPFIIDSAPFKQGKYAPASHVPIVSPDYAAEHIPDVILISAPGYTEEIAEIIRKRFGEKTEILILKTNNIASYRKDLVEERER